MRLNILNTKLGQNAYRQKYNIPDSVPINISNNTNGGLPDSVFLGFYDANENQIYKSYNEL